MPNVSAPPKPDENGLKSVAIYRRDDRRLDQIAGDSVSTAKKVEAILDVIQRERLVEKVRRKILGVAEAGEEVLRRITPAEPAPSPSESHSKTGDGGR